MIHFHRIAALVTLVTVLVPVGSRSSSASGGSPPRLDQPNIVLFLVDDMGWQDTSVQFHTRRTVWNDLYNTPNMQRLADQGMRFTNAYAASPVCSPTRCSLMTGRNPGRTRITDWIGHGVSTNQHVTSPAWAASGLQPDDGNITLPSLLRAAGCRTAFVGKAHFGANGTEGEDPVNLGFDINVGGSAFGSPRGRGERGAYFAPFPTAMMPGLEQHDDGSYLTEVLTEEANAIIDQAVADSAPLFVLISHYAIHAPIAGQGDPRYVEQYQATNRPEPEADYAAMIESMDASLGAVLDNLQSEGIAERTLVMFVSDNGGLSNHTRDSGDQRIVQTLRGRDVSVQYTKDEHNRPLRGGKGSGYEGGLRVPMIVAWAGQQPEDAPINDVLPIAPGSVCHEPVMMDDFFPTVLNVANITSRSQITDDREGENLPIIDGRDLSPLLAGETFDRDGGLHFHYPHQWYGNIGIGDGIEPFTAVRFGEYKLIYFYGDGVRDGTDADPRWELYNLAHDLSEQNDLSRSQPAVLSALRERMLAWMRDVKAQTPISRSSGQPIPLPTPRIRPAQPPVLTPDRPDASTPFMPESEPEPTRGPD